MTKIRIHQEGSQGIRRDDCSGVQEVYLQIQGIWDFTGFLQGSFFSKVIVGVICRRYVNVEKIKNMSEVIR